MNYTYLLLISFFGIVNCVGRSHSVVITMPPKYEHGKYKPDWHDLDSRPLPMWYDKAKIGIFIHWGVYSVPGVASEWFWANWKAGYNPIINKFMKTNYPSYFTYQDFAPQFTAEFFNATQWAKIIKSSGAKYVVLTSKHHDGFALFPSSRSFSWNSMDVGPRRDIVGELSRAVRKENVIFGVYHSLYEWFNPMYLADKKSNFTTKNYTLNKLWPDIQQLVNDYRPSVIWADGDWEARDTYWQSPELLAWLYNDSPVKNKVVVNDRWGIGVQCHHGDFFNCEDRYNPGVLQPHKWENAFTLDKKSWGHRKNMEFSDVMNTTELFKEVVTTISCGGNVLINIGPTQHGTISPIFVERLQTLGKWLEINGRAIYETSPWFHQNDTLNNHVWYTCRTSSFNEINPVEVPESVVKEVYAIILSWPMDNVLRLKDIAKDINADTKVYLFGYKQPLEYVIKEGIVIIRLPSKQMSSSEHAWVVQFIIH